MNVEKELSAAPAIVKDILQRCPAARDCDPLLYVKVVEVLNPSVLGMNFEDVMLNLEDLGLLKFETVRRTRQKLQAEYPNLKPCKEVQEFRSENEEVFRRFAND